MRPGDCRQPLRTTADLLVADEPFIDLAWRNRRATASECGPGASAVTPDLLSALLREAETIGLFAAGTTSLVNAIADDIAEHRLLVSQLPSALPDDPRLLSSALASLIGCGLDDALVAGIQDLPMRLALARRTAMSLTQRNVLPAARELACDAWRRVCLGLLEVIRALRRERGGPASRHALPNEPSAERLLAAAALGGTPCIGPDGIVELPGWLERRARPRILLDHPAILTIANTSYEIVVRDISRGGAGLADVPEMDAASDCVLSLGARAIRGVILWRGEGRCGIRFDEELADLEEVLADIGHPL